LVLDNGDPFILEPFQRTIMKPHFAGAVEEVAILPTGNAKSTLLAARGLHHMLTTEHAECIIAAAAADQAAIIFDQMAGFVRGSDLPLDVKLGIRAIYHKGDGPNRKPLGRIRVISADAGKNSGAIPSLVLVDELQAHPDGHLYNMLQQRLDKRHAQMLTISNAGWDERSFLAQLRKQAYEHESFTRRGMFNHARTESMEFLEWCLGEKDDPHDVRTVKCVNPLKAITIEGLERRLNSWGLIWPEWLRMTCGIWTTVEMPWLPEDAWEACKADIGGVAEGDEVFVSVRVGAGAGIAIVAPRGEDRVAVKVQILDPPAQGRLPFKSIEFALRRIAEQYEVVSIGYDPDQFRPSAEVLMEAGLPMEEQPQRVTRLSVATSALYRLISAGLLSHDGDPALRAQVRAGKAKETTQGWHLEPTAETNGLIALAMASLEATKAPPEMAGFEAL